MGMDIRLINLYRRSIKPPSGTENGGGDGDALGIQSFFATDYFDELSVNKKSLQNTLPDILGIRMNEKKHKNEEDASVQSYAIYSNSNIIKRRTEEERDLFEDNQQLPYLSIIQVHITPEVMSKICINDKEQNDTEKIMQKFADDLEDVIKGFADSHINNRDTCSCRIYNMLASGDFAVIIRSRQPETSFKISTCLRRHMAACRVETGEEPKKKACLAIYKTYTLLTMRDVDSGPADDQEIIITENRKERDKNESGNHFVIRGCFSNNYWKNHDETELENEKIEVEKISSKLYGRYDFSMELTEEDFKIIFPVLRKYKNLDSSTSDINGVCWKNHRNSYSSHVRYLLYLLQKDYISYVNERLLLDYEKIKAEKSSDEEKTFSTRIFIDRDKFEKKPLLYDKNRKRNKEIQRLFEKVRVMMESLPGYHQNLKYYMQLINKLVQICNAINESSDIRISISMLLEQLHIALMSISIYIEIYRNCHDKSHLKLLETYLRITVSALNSFAGYIRNNNLQTLQTPNYNVETGSSMEKLLISYSEILRTVIEYYQKESTTDIRNMHPIVVPQLKEQDLSVEIMFPDGMSTSWEKEEEVRAQKSLYGNFYLMVVTSPTLREIGDITISLPLMLHELAHQFRYETREERNDTLLKIGIENTLSFLGEGIEEEMQSVVGIEDTGRIFLELAEEAFAGKLLEVFFTEKAQLMYEYRNTPLEFFKYQFSEDIMHIFDGWDYEKELKKSVVKFSESTIDFYVNGDDNLDSCIVNVCNSLEKAESIGVAVAEGRMLDETAAEELGNCVENILEEIKRYKQIIISRCSEKREQEYLQRKMEGFCGTLQARLDTYDIDTAISAFRMAGKRKQYLDEVYNEMSDEWQKIMEQIKESSVLEPDNVKSESDYKEWSMIGRLFGIDYKSQNNKGNFEKKMMRIIKREKMPSVEMAGIEMGIYREETSDLFMVCVMGLNPLGYVNLMMNGVFDDENLSPTQVKRIGDILTLILCGEVLDAGREMDVREIHKNYYMQGCREVMRNIYKTLKNIFEYYMPELEQWEPCAQREELKSFASGIIHSDIKEKLDKSSSGEMSVLLKELSEKLSVCRRNICDVNRAGNAALKEEFLEAIMRNLNIVNAMYVMAGEGTRFISRLQKNKEYFIDLHKGYKEYKQIAEKMLGESNEDIRSIAVECKLCAQQLNQPHLLYVDGGGQCISEKEACRKYSMEFWSKMYYKCRLRYAQNNGREEEDAG